MKRIFSAGRGLAFIVFMTVFLFTAVARVLNLNRK